MTNKSDDVFYSELTKVMLEHSSLLSDQELEKTISSFDDVSWPKTMSDEDKRAATHRFMESLKRFDSGKQKNVGRMAGHEIRDEKKSRKRHPFGRLTSKVLPWAAAVAALLLMLLFSWSKKEREATVDLTRFRENEMFTRGSGGVGPAEQTVSDPKSLWIARREYLVNNPARVERMSASEKKVAAECLRRMDLATTAQLIQQVEIATKLLQESDELVRIEAVKSLATLLQRVGTREPPLSKSFFALLERSDKHLESSVKVRLEAVTQLGRFSDVSSEKKKKVTSALCGIVAYDDVSIVGRASNAILRLGCLDKSKSSTVILERLRRETDSFSDVTSVRYMINVLKLASSLNEGERAFLIEAEGKLVAVTKGSKND